MNEPLTSALRGGTRLAVSPRPLRETIVPLLIAVLLGSSLLGLVAHRLITIERAWDYVFHIEAARLTSSGALLPPHFLFHVAVIAVHALVPAAGWAACALVVLVSFQAALVALLFLGLLAPLRRLGVEGAGLAAGFLALGLVTVSPVSLFALVDRHLYFGYVPTNTYHNPTVVVLKPLALGLYLLVSRAFRQPSVAKGWGWATGTTALSIASTLAKPLYTACLVPAVFAMWIRGAWTRRPVAWQPLLACVVVPGVLTLGVQSILGARIQGSFHVVFAPLLSVAARSDWLLPKFLLSVLFPLTVCLAHRGALRNAELALAWISFVFGSLYTYFLAEAGPRALDGNLWWGAQVSLFILFYASLRICVEEGGAFVAGGRALFLCGGAFVLHCAAGVVWYYVHLALVFSW